MFKKTKTSFFFLFFLFCRAASATPGTPTQQIIIHTKNIEIPITVELAQTPSEQARGLMFRDSLPADFGMLFVYGEDSARSFWMKNTSISLDIVFIDARGHIVFIAQNTTPFSEKLVMPSMPCRFVLEVNAGVVNKHQIKAGDFVSQIEGVAIQRDAEQTAH